VERCTRGAVAGRVRKCRAGHRGAVNMLRWLLRLGLVSLAACTALCEYLRQVTPRGRTNDDGEKKKCERARVCMCMCACGPFGAASGATSLRSTRSAPPPGGGGGTYLALRYVDRMKGRLTSAQIFSQQRSCLARLSSHRKRLKYSRYFCPHVSISTHL
jgi:hypothetical protein